MVAAARAVLDHLSLWIGFSLRHQHKAGGPHMTDLQQEALERASSPFWRRVVKIVHSPLFTITHVVVYFAWHHFVRLFSFPEEKVWSPQRLRSWVRDKATGFQAYS